MTSILPDQAEREQALDISHSFIVQAPAGSGKTELLTQRYLALLAQVQKSPEEIIAITFTRKAAAEMKARLINALMLAKQEQPTTNPHEFITRQLARKVLLRDQLLQWKLLDNPSRLRIQTIDSLCARLTAQMPIVSRFGTLPKISEDAHELYRQAVLDILATLDQALPWSESLATLLLHLDNDCSKALRLFVDMLSRREQWLPHIIGNNPRENLERALAGIVEEHLLRVKQQLDPIDTSELLSLLRFAAKNVVNNDSFSPLANCQDLYQIPEADPEQLAQWFGLAYFLLTKEGSFRRRLTVKEGFPAPSSASDKLSKSLFQEMKQRMSEVLEQLSDNEELRQVLADILELPPLHYNDNQWQIIEALLIVLPVLVAQLHLLFKEYCTVDYTEVVLKASSALGSLDAPTDLALSLDYQIFHMLVDEFQDTSITQFRLLELLTAGWEPQDGRTIFLVGDPMQSIYRFRKAEVGLFLQAQQQGIGTIPLIPLTLSANFRSNSNIISWINQTGQTIFPKIDDLITGAIRFNPAKAMINVDPVNAVTIHTLIDQEDVSEAEAILTIIQQTKIINPQTTIAILVQARSHLTHILQRLKLAKIDYRAVEIDALGNRPIIQDLSVLTRALLHLSDRVAWFAILRAPWCGLSLADLLVIANHKPNQTIWDSLQQFNSLQLSAEGRQRLERIVPILLKSIQNRQRKRLHHWLEYTWLALGGPACLQSFNDLEDAKAFFKLLAKIEIAGDIPDPQLLSKAIEKLYSSSASEAENPVEIMTIHKAKGLEFDTVILAGLEKRTRADSHQLLLWQEQPTRRGQTELILAPIKNSNDEPIYDYLRKQEAKKAQNELTRLLYVAITRTKNNLHIIARLKQKDGAIEKPDKGTLLEKLWLQLSETCLQAKPPEKTTFNSINSGLMTSNHPLRRLALPWRHPLCTIDDLSSKITNPSSRFEYASPTDSFKQIGTVVHRLLYQLSQLAQKMQNKDWVIGHRDLIRQLLIQAGITHEELNYASNQVEQALINTLADSRGHWILASDHQEAASEYPISAVIDSEIHHFIMDRTFVAEGVRWIIDYKTTKNNSENIQGFLQLEIERHRPQLERYAQVFQLQENRPIRLGLYFPLLKSWHEWEYTTNFSLLNTNLKTPLSY
jgi:ATP-dependent exoDNAse (exonuclease V) beta subunit